jgi:hypothetical protein
MAFLSAVTCLVTTTNVRKVIAMFESWGKLCETLVLLTTVGSDVHTNLSHLEMNRAENVHILAGSHPEETGKRFFGADFKTMLGFWREVHKRFSSSSWFICVPDSTYVILPNLKRYIALLDYDPLLRGRPQYVGRPLRYPGGMVVNSVSTGFLLNRFALEILLNATDAYSPDQKLTYRPFQCASTALPQAANDTCGMWKKAAPEVSPMMCNPTIHSVHGGGQAETCMALYLANNEIYPLDTRDSSQANRFHVYGPNMSTDATKAKVAVYPDGKQDLYRAQSELRDISEHSVSFAIGHNDGIAKMLAFDAFLHERCKHPTSIEPTWAGDSFGQKYWQVHEWRNNKARFKAKLSHIIKK